LQASIDHGALANYGSRPKLGEDHSPHTDREAAVEEQKQTLARIPFMHQDPTRPDIADLGALTAAQDSTGKLILDRGLQFVLFFFHVPTLLH
jgi:hypothetical protein